MKKSIFRVLSSTALATVLIVPTALASELGNYSDSSEVKTIQQLQERYNLESTKDIPKGAVPPRFNTVQEANTYLSGAITPAATQVVTKTGSFKSTTASKLQVTLGYETVNGRINLLTVSSQAVGDGAFSFKQSSYSTQRLDGGRSMGVTVNGVLTKTVVVNGQIKKTTYNESVYVEI